MPNQHEYRNAARVFRDNAGEFRSRTEGCQASLPSTELEGTFRGYFESSLLETLGVATWFEGQLDYAAAECDRRAKVCQKYTDDLMLHRRFPQIYDEPEEPEPWVEEG